MTDVTPSDPFVVLGISREATVEEARQAYKRLARKHHPDKGGDPAKFREINEALTRVQKLLIKCPVCDGTGKVKIKRGRFTDTENCPRCWK